MTRKPCIRNPETNSVQMSPSNIQISLRNQTDSFSTPYLNNSLHLQYYVFSNIANLTPFTKVHTLFLNNNTIQTIEGLQNLSELIYLNLANNRICKVQGLRHLQKLHTLDLSHNFVEHVQEEEVHTLTNLNTLNLKNNKLGKVESVVGIKGLIALTSLDLADNQAIESNVLHDLLGELKKLSVLSLKNTELSRAMPSYRKEIITRLDTLVYLDDRPVTEDERLLAQQWKKGGIKQQRQARIKLKQKSQLKAAKISQQYAENTEKYEQKVQKLYQSLSYICVAQLAAKQSLKSIVSPLPRQQTDLLNTQIQELQTYLQLLRAAVRQMDVDRELQPQGTICEPTMLIERQTSEAIYVYNISETQLPLVKRKFYPEQMRPIIPVSTTVEETRWVPEYESLLEQCLRKAVGNSDLVLPLFNLAVYEFDKAHKRKLKRLTKSELNDRISEWQHSQEHQELKAQNLNSLD